MRIAMLVVFACCTIFSLVTAALVFTAEQPGSAAFFLAFSLLFGGLTTALLQGMRRRKSPAGGTPAGGGQHPGFVPHRFVVAALLVTFVIVVGSILWRLVR